MKYPKWKVNVASHNFYTVETEGATRDDAVKMALKLLESNPEYYLTGTATIITGIFINDRECRDFHLYVPETLSNDSAEM